MTDSEIFQETNLFTLFFLLFFLYFFFFYSNALLLVTSLPSALGTMARHAFTLQADRSRVWINHAKMAVVTAPEYVSLVHFRVWDGFTPVSSAPETGLKHSKSSKGLV
ncbi:hypothetical protein GOODEAATRI_027076 [Goodea atripinnis]|uniref:Uncharacterized protein n=1 Tax=Goodea atripinnis TaxID=208336 RepID=A0ABV0Q1F9_9TELE